MPICGFLPTRPICAVNFRNFGGTAVDHLQKDLFSCIRAALTDEAVKLSGESSVQALYDLAKRHHIIPLVYHGLYKMGADCASVPQFEEVALHFTLHDQLQSNTAFAILDAFSKNGIDHMLLKGTSIKHLYPASEMRLMSDIDILIRESQYEAIRPIMTSLGFKQTSESDHEMTWKKAPKLTVELHMRLIPSYNDDYYEYYRNPWERAVPVADVPHRYVMSHEDEYIFIFTHMTKHYRDGGIGVKHFVDLWLYAERHPAMNGTYVREELTKLGLYEFYENITRTVDVWFASGLPDAITEHITERIVQSGVFGRANKGAAAKAARASARRSGSMAGTRVRETIRSVFLPFSSMQRKYPVLKKIPILLPVFWIVRLVSALVFRRKNVRKIAKYLAKINESDVGDYNRELALVGLRFDLKTDPTKYHH